MGRVRENQQWLNAHTLTDNGKIFLWNLSVFLLCSTQVKIVHDLYNFRDAHAILVVTPATNALPVDTPLV